MLMIVPPRSSIDAANASIISAVPTTLTASIALRQSAARSGRESTPALFTRMSMSGYVSTSPSTVFGGR